MYYILPFLNDHILDAMKELIHVQFYLCTVNEHDTVMTMKWDGIVKYSVFLLTLLNKIPNRNMFTQKKCCIKVY